MLLLKRRACDPPVTQAEVAGALNMTTHTVSQVEADKIGLDPETYRRWDAAIDKITKTRGAKDDHG